MKILAAQLPPNDLPAVRWKGAEIKCSENPPQTRAQKSSKYAMWRLPNSVFCKHWSSEHISAVKRKAPLASELPLQPSIANRLSVYCGSGCRPRHRAAVHQPGLRSPRR
jgi:hypothetical protein